MGRLVRFLILLLAACQASDPEAGVSRESVSLTREEAEAARRPPRQPPAWFETQLALVEQERKQGKVRDAFVRILRAKEENPGSEHEAVFNKLLTEINNEVLEMDTLVGWFVAEQDPIVFGEALRVRVRLHNPTARHIRIAVRNEPITVHAKPKKPGKSTVVKSSTSRFILDVVSREFDVRAQVVRNHRRMHRELERELDFPPGSTRELVLDLGPVDNDRPLAGFRSYTVGGGLRAAAVEVAGMRRWEAIEIAEGHLRSFRPGYEHLADDPVRRIGQAIEKGAYVHLLTATALVPFERRRDATDRLVEGLGHRSSLDFTLFACLQFLTGTELGRDVDAWRAWWPRVRETYYEPRAKERTPGKPVFAD
ncbi:MAG: hypothetical protein ACYTG3_13855 [Planctomycetota bacterium]